MLRFVKDTCPMFTRLILKQQVSKPCARHKAFNPHPYTQTPPCGKPEQGAREGATLWLVPVSISYERVPEQARLAEELLTPRDREGSGGGHQRRQQQQQHLGAVGLTGLLR